MTKISSIFRLIYNNRSFNKIFAFTLIFILFFPISSINNVVGEEGSSESQIHIYVCDGINASAYEGATSVDGSFDNDDGEFTSSDYSIIDENDDNYVNDETYSTLVYQYHRFEFSIVEDINDITQIDITWKGEGGADLLSYPPAYNINFSFWVKEESGGYIEKYSSTYLDTFTVTYNSISAIKRVTGGGHIYCGAQSDYRIDALHTYPSYINSYYVEVKVTYLSSDLLNVSNPSSVLEGDSFDVVVTSDDVPVEAAFVEFNGLNFSTDEFGAVTFSAPVVDNNISYDIVVSKDGYIGNVSSIVVLDNSSSEVPVLDVSVPSSVLEDENFDVTVSSDGSHVVDVDVLFDGEVFVTDVDGVVSLVAPLVGSGTSFDVVVSKEGYVGNSSSVLVLNNDSSSVLDPELVIVSPVSVYENAGFDVTVSSDGSPVVDVDVLFDGEVFVTDVDGVVSLVASLVDSKTDFVISASKSGFVSDSRIVSVLDTLETSIILLYPGGGETLSGVVDILWDVANPPVSDVSIGLLYQVSGGSWVSIVEGLSITDNSYSWDTGGVEDGGYLLKVVLTVGDVVYEDVSDSTFDINNDEIVEYGWFYGSVFEMVNGNKTPLENSMVCLINSSNAGYQVYKCRFTDKNGEYIISSIPVGFYCVSASKKGYVAETCEGVQIKPGDGKEVNFTLEKTAFETFDTYIDYMIDQEIRKDSIFGMVDVSSDEDVVFLYGDVDVSILSSDIFSEEGVSVVVSGMGAPGTKLVIYLGVVETPDALVVEYDGSVIGHAVDFESFFEMGYDKSEYALATVSKGDVTESIIIVNIPSYSEHTITISSVIESINVFFMIILYILIFTILGIFYISPFFIIRKSK